MNPRRQHMICETKNRHALDPELWIEKYSLYLTSYTRTRVQNNQAVEDIVHETFLSALRAMESYRGASTEKTWLTGILKNKIVDHYRYINSRKGSFQRGMIPFSEYAHNRIHGLDTILEDVQFDATSELRNQELQLLLEQSLRSLSPREAQVIRLRVEKAYTAKDICAELGISKPNLWTLLSRARKKIYPTLIKAL